MSGGLGRFRVRCCAPIAMTGIAAWLPLTPPMSRAAEVLEEPAAAIASDSESEAVASPVVGGSREQSILIAAERLSIAPTDLMVASDHAEEPPLEPIASVSDYESALAPELADPVPSTAVPDLAEAGADPSAPDAIASDAAEPSIDALVEDVSPEEAAVAAADGSSDAPELGPACFLGITPGLSTRDEVLESWGVPTSGGASSPRLAFSTDEFPEIVVFLVGDMVELLRVQLPSPMETAELQQRLGLQRIRPVSEYTTAGKMSGTAFPERGVALIHESGTDVAMASDATHDRAPIDVERVFQIEVRNLRADDFVARAAQADPRAYALRVADLETALRLDGQNAEVRRQLSELKLKLGLAVAAERLAAEAVELTPTNDEYRLHWARCLAVLARYDVAVRECRQVLDNGAAPLLVRAQALHHMGRLASLGSREVVQRSIPLYNKSIEMADKLAVDADPAVRLAAQQLLVESHLAVAEQIAQGDFQRKDEFVAQWVGRASALVEQMIASGDADVSWRVKVATAALSAGSQLQPPIDPELWIAEAEDAVQELRAATEDEDALAEIDWQLGLAYFYATEIEHRRGDADVALQYGDVADALLGPLADRRDEVPDAAFLLGRLYFQMGAVHAVHREDHREACKLYDKAVDRLLRPMPVTTLAKPGQHGDALVSMGVSYWHVGRRARAYELTRAGVELVQQGIAEGLVAESAGNVARDNLASMARALGKSETLVPSVDVPTTKVAQAAPAVNAPVTPTPRTAAAPQTAQRPLPASSRGGGPARGVMRR